MTYLREPDASSYKQNLIDLPRFAADLAHELGARLLPSGEYPLEDQKIAYGGNELHLRAVSFKRPPTVSVSIEAPDVPWNERTSYASHKTTSAKVDPEKRSIKAIAVDIKRRVISPSTAALDAQRKHVIEQKERSAGVAKAASDLKAEFAGLDVRFDPERNSQSAVVYSNGSASSFSARIEPYGVQIDRIGSISMEKFKAIVEILLRKEGAA